MPYKILVADHLQPGDFWLFSSLIRVMTGIRALEPSVSQRWSAGTNYNVRGSNLPTQ